MSSHRVATVATLWVTLVCATADAAPKRSWRHGSSARISRGRPGHASNDLIVNPGAGAVIEGKFAYGKLSRDLEDEDVSLWLIRGGRWRRIATARTNRDGRIKFAVPASQLARKGPVQYALIVDADGTRTRGTIWVLEPKARVVVFDIDGTLSSGGFVRKNLWGKKVLPRPNAASLTQRWVDAGYLPVYLTARPYLYTSYSRAWLSENGFASGPVVHSDSLGAGMPGHRRAGAFKAGYLLQLVKATRVIVAAAYGDQDSDVCAFANAGVDLAVTFIWGKQTRSCNGNGAAQAILDYGANHILPILTP